MEHVELDEFLEVIADIKDAGWAVKVVRENEMISDQVAAKNMYQLSNMRCSTLNRILLKNP